MDRDWFCCAKANDFSDVQGYNRQRGTRSPRSNKEKQTMTPNEYCQNKAAQSGSSFYYSFLFLPAEQKQAIMALYAFCREVDDVVDECTDVGVARIKLQWWRDEIARMFNGQPQHPVAQALATTIARFNLPQEHFLEIIDGMEMDLDVATYATFRDLSLYIHRVASMVGLMSAEIFGFEDRKTLKYAHDLGTAFQLTNILRDLREDASLGRVYLPQEDLARFGLSTQDVLALRMSDEMKKMLAFQAQRAREFYRKAFEHLPEGDRARQRSGIIMAEIYQTVLDEIEADGFEVFSRRIRLTPIRKLWIAWRAARREAQRAKRYQQTQSHATP